MSLKDMQSNVQISMKGCSFYGKLSKFINYDSCYKMLMLFEWKMNEIKYLKCWSFCEEQQSIMLVSNEKKYLILGDKFGLIRIYKISKKKKQKKNSSNFYDLNLIKSAKNNLKENETNSYKFKYNENLLEPINNQQLNEKTTTGKKTPLKSEKEPQKFEIRLELKKNLKSHFVKLNTNETSKKFLKFSSVKNLNNEIIYSKRDFLNFYDILSNKKDKGVSSTNIKKDTHQLEFFKLLTGHSTEITFLEICYSFSVLISCDKEGIICLWKVSNGKLIQKIYSYHFSEKKIFKQICYYDYKEFFGLVDKNTKYHKIILQREKIKGLSVCQENGDFSVSSENYLSVYSINGVLISILNRSLEKLPKFSTSLILQVTNIKNKI